MACVEFVDAGGLRDVAKNAASRRADGRWSTTPYTTGSPFITDETDWPLSIIRYYDTIITTPLVQREAWRFKLAARHIGAAVLSFSNRNNDSIKACACEEADECRVDAVDLPSSIGLLRIESATSVVEPHN